MMHDLKIKVKKNVVSLCLRDNYLFLKFFLEVSDIMCTRELKAVLMPWQL